MRRSEMRSRRIGWWLYPVLDITKSDQVGVILTEVNRSRTGCQSATEQVCPDHRGDRMMSDRIGEVGDSRWSQGECPSWFSEYPEEILRSRRFVKSEMIGVGNLKVRDGDRVR